MYHGILFDRRLGKSLIYQSFVFGKDIIDGHSPKVIVIPLGSIVQEQLTSNEFNLKAVELTLQDDVLKNVNGGKVEVVYTSAENVSNDKFLSILRDSNSSFKRRRKVGNMSTAAENHCMSGTCTGHGVQACSPHPLVLMMLAS